uniref:Uncharacterized protein n=1 Tax=Arundo donax TaxID=35708 RepID=A0A0A9BL97_ARUDO
MQIMYRQKGKAIGCHEGRSGPHESWRLVNARN